MGNVIRLDKKQFLGIELSKSVNAPKNWGFISSTVEILSNDRLQHPTFEEDNLLY
jgi:hypothetical protein